MRVDVSRCVIEPGMLERWLGRAVLLLSCRCATLGHCSKLTLDSETAPMGKLPSSLPGGESDPFKAALVVPRWLCDASDVMIPGTANV